MTADFRIRPLVPGDAAGVLAIEHAVWADSRLDPAGVAALAARPEHAVHVAEAGGAIAGFAWGFLARTLGHGTAWELDLLAVSPDQRGRGIGRALVRSLYDAGRRHGAPRCRAIVAETNVSSQHAFRAAGFAQDHALRDLLIRAVRGADMPAAPPTYERDADYDSYLFRPEAPPARLTRPLARSVDATGGGEPPDYLEGLPVHTLLYAGLWLEALGYRGREALGRLVRQAEEFARGRGLADLGHLARPGAWRTRDDLVSQGFQVENSYYEFERPY